MRYFFNMISEIADIVKRGNAEIGRYTLDQLLEKIPSMGYQNRINISDGALTISNIVLGEIEPMKTTNLTFDENLDRIYLAIKEKAGSSNNISTLDEALYEIKNIPINSTVEQIGNVLIFKS